MDAATIAKIRAHKFGRRKLTSNSAWTAYNKKIKLEEKYADFITAVAADINVQAHVNNLNTQLKAACTALGMGELANAGTIEIVAPNKMFIPRSVWMGYINLPTGSLTGAQRTAFQAAEASFADQAGLLRERIARIYAVYGVLNDVGNSDQAPNTGGAVGD